MLIKYHHKKLTLDNKKGERKSESDIRSMLETKHNRLVKYSKKWS